MKHLFLVLAVLALIPVLPPGINPHCHPHLHGHHVRVCVGA